MLLYFLLPVNIIRESYLVNRISLKNKQLKYLKIKKVVCLNLFFFRDTRY